MTVSDLEQRADAAAARGAYPAAVALLEQRTTEAPADAPAWIKLAAMYRATGRLSAGVLAVERALALEPLDFLALLMKANLLDRLGDAGAGEAYGHALAQQPPGEVSSGLAASLGQARGRYAVLQTERAARLEASMAAAGASATADERTRMARFRSNVVRQTRVYHAEPTHYHYPGLVEREFHDRAKFPWLAALEAATDAIAEEFGRVVASERAELVPYVQYAPGIPLRQWQPLNHSLDWTAIHLLRKGERVAANADLCPATMAALAAVPQPQIAGRTPNAMFSMLAPGAHIPPHHGIANTRLVCHLPLIVPPGCWFRVGAETRSWRRGEAFVFDDTIEHEAANGGEELRVVLIVDLWHPGLSPIERQAVAALMMVEEDVRVDGL